MVRIAIAYMVYTSSEGKSRENGNSMKRKNCAVTTLATTNPTNVPRISEDKITLYYSNMNAFMP